MSKKILSASYERNEYEKTVFTEAIVYTRRLVQNTATKITNSALTSFGIAVAPAGTTYSATSTRYAFDTLVGNLPWSSYSKFAYTQPRVSNPSLPLASLPSSGSITLSETIGGTPRTEVMYYGSITWLTATTGIFNNVKRAGSYGGTSYVFTDAAVGTFTNVVPVREYIKIWNRTGADLWIGADGAINATPTNAVKLLDNGEWGMWLEPLQDLWLFSADATADVNIAEYR
jgi:hypothetical protein